MCMPHARMCSCQACIAAGIGFHNAAMESEDRALVEQLFLASDLPVRGAITKNL